MPKKPDEDKFVKETEEKVISTIRKYSLIRKNEHVGVAVSGGKDSTALLYILKKYGYNVTGITVDAHIGCYTDENLARLKELCKKINVKLHVVSFRETIGSSMCYLREKLEKKGFGGSPCAVCGVFRRSLLNQAAKKLRLKKIATGHNLDDIAQSMLMNAIKKRDGKAYPCTSKIASFPQRIKPLFFIAEKDIIKYCKKLGFDVKFTRCPCSKESFRAGTRKFMAHIEKKYPNAKQEIITHFFGKTPLPKGIIHCQKCGNSCSGKTCKPCELLFKARL